MQKMSKVENSTRKNITIMVKSTCSAEKKNLPIVKTCKKCKKNHSCDLGRFQSVTIVLGKDRNGKGIL